MIQKRNISTFAIGLCLLAFMLLSASPAKAFKTTDWNMKQDYKKCLKKDEVVAMKKCFKKFRKTHKSACLVEERYLDVMARTGSSVTTICKVGW